MLTITFYSFRGGVGRTMALANVAAHLARQGKSVFLVDFDLEAPGLSLMPEFRPETPLERQDGLVGYLRAGLEDRELPSLRSLCYEPPLARKLRKQDSDAGDIHMLPADARHGDQRQYDLARLHLDRLYETQGRSLVIDALKVEIEQEYHPDYVLVDSRTGLTDAGGICTVHLADLLVIVSGLNAQNLEGTCLAVERLQRARTDFAQNVLFVISPVPVGEETLKAERLNAAAERFAVVMQVACEEVQKKLLTVPYHPQIALTEESFVFHHPHSPVSAAFRRIAEAIRDHNPNDLDKEFERLAQRIKRGDNRAIGELLALADRDSAPYGARMMAAAIHLESQEYEPATRLLESILVKKPDNSVALNNLGIAFTMHANTKSGREADSLFALAGEKYAAALQIEPDDHEALTNWGNAISHQARTKSATEADALFAEACKKYQAALQIKPDDHEVLSNWGAALSFQARKKAGMEADMLFAEACEKYKAALQIKHNDHAVLNNWGTALLEKARRTSGADAEALFAQAEEKLIAAEQLQHGAGAYDLACLAAIRGHSETCQQWLEQARAAGTLPPPKHLADDTDLASVRNEPWFRKLMASLPGVDESPTRSGS